MVIYYSMKSIKNKQQRFEIQIRVYVKKTPEKSKERLAIRFASSPCIRLWITPVQTLWVPKHPLSSFITMRKKGQCMLSSLVEYAWNWNSASSLSGINRISFLLGSQWRSHDNRWGVCPRRWNSEARTSESSLGTYTLPTMRSGHCNAEHCYRRSSKS